jgi:two-component system, OmpR family, phosphate regulon response regulator PhoB
MNAMMEGRQELRILLADNDDRIASVIQASLENAGFDVARVSSAEEALKALHETKPALVILDMMIPGMAGTDLLRTLRANPETSAVPLVALSKCSEEIDRIIALELGADDFVAKPFSARELTLRVRAILSRKRTQSPKPKRIRVGRFTLDRENREVAVDGVPVPLSVLDYRLLAALISEGRRVVSRERLIELAWKPESKVSRRTVDTQLRRLRVKIGSAAEKIETVRGFGYRLSD